MDSISTLIVPALGPGLQAIIRGAYGILMLLTLFAALPHARRYFFSERWGGYTESSRLTDIVQRPSTVAVMLAGWMAAAAGLAFGVAVLPAAAVNLLCCYYFFNRLRWTSVSRGMGAPGFIALWLGAAVFALELTSRHAPSARGIVLATAQLDFAAIMISAGLYKLAAGYRRQHGMELGMVNPEWGYWPAFWKGWRPDHPLFRVFDEAAWMTEVGGGVLMLIPQTRAIGALVILFSFIFIATQIRLGFLCEMVVVSCLLFLGGTSLDVWAAARFPAAGAFGPAVALPSIVQAAVIALCVVYLAALLPVRAALFYNQLKHRPLPGPAQTVVDAYANAVGMILWRVFTADVVNFFVRIWELPSDGARRLISAYPRTGPSRFAQVAECVALTSVFTTLKYYPSNRTLFTDRLLRYARTIPRGRDSRLVFEWVGVVAQATRFDFVPAAEFTVDLATATVTEAALSDPLSVRGVPECSPVHEGRRPGSYAPLAPRT